MDEHVGPTRRRAVEVCAQQWSDALIDFGPYNTLLHFKDTKRATLDVTYAAPQALTPLLNGRTTRLASLFPASDDHKTAWVRARGLRRKMVELAEEQGIEVGRLALGLVRVEPPTTRGSRPLAALRAPLLLQPLTIEPRTATESDFVLEGVSEAEINPVLLYALSRQYGLDGDIEELSDKIANAVEECADPAERTRCAYAVLQTACTRSHLSVELEERVVAGVFSFDRLPMVNDLARSVDLLASHQVVAALAKDKEAERALRAEGASHVPSSADSTAPRSEYLVQDANGSQQKAISAALAGSHLVIEGPPGTGKSQTIANLIAVFAALGKRTLFVAEKRAAIEAVTDSLAEVDLDGLVFDLHGNKLSRRQTAQQLYEALERAGKEPPPRPDGLHRSLDGHRGQALRHVQEFHQALAPWEISPYQLITRLMASPRDQHTRLRLRGGDLYRLHGEQLLQTESDLRALVAKNGLLVRRGSSPWSHLPVRSDNELHSVVASLDQLTGRALTDARRTVVKLVNAAGLRPADDVHGWQSLLTLLHDVTTTLSRFEVAVFDSGLNDMIAATADRAWRKERSLKVGWWQRRKLTARARGLAKDGCRTRLLLHAALTEAADQKARWQQHAATDDSSPWAVPGLSTAVASFTQARDQLAAIALCVRWDGWENTSTDEVDRFIQRLDQDRATLLRMPELNQLTDRLESIGLGHFLDELAEAGTAPDVAVGTLNHLWWASVLDEAHMQHPYLRSFVGTEHDHTIDQFQRLDRTHRDLNPARVRYEVATRLRKARDTHPDQNTLVRTQAHRKSRHLSLRRLVEKAPDVLMAAKPCWAMSPLVVSRVLPATRLFDVVIFDEASQVPPQDAITSIMRAHQVIVAGDPHQLPPTTFFQKLLSGADEDSDDDESGDAAPDAFESLLDMLCSHLPVHTLKWHYRSRDERLIAFANHTIYNDTLVTFPGTTQASPLRLDIVDAQVRPGQSGSSDEEVQRVVDLALAHATHTPGQSLGVITMGQRHAERIELALTQALKGHPDLQDYFSPDAGPRQRFFVKTIEQVQGDERDAIILSIGYGKAANGRLAMNFGPLNNEGGERRLNVAITRARQSMTVVTSFTHHDFDPSKLLAARHRGPEMLRAFLEYASHGGDLQRTGSARTDWNLNGFEQQVLAALEAADVPVTPQWGVSGYRIDFALGHPTRPGQMVLAVETDGDRYHRAPSARDRDRLRQEHLQRLGWRFHRIWASSWFANPSAELERLLDIWRDATERADRAPTPDPVHNPPAPPPAVGRGARPTMPQGGRTADYSDADLLALATWLLSDGYQLDRDTRVGQALTELGFKRRGRVITERLIRAFEQAQHPADKEAY
ncbi:MULTISPECIES: AAA domain-containing protein [unclassified Streptomyces]|uniref:AAA domain-containing protein n=1 Tax=unclassified Streptomyces TaxID=2593676 RepID=UPI000DC2C6F0|nr:AAA domain-containing protein [Streptomyces sp. PsTaAH-137]MYT73759.1 AAA family ATPase [Streptomyces sp. SID8367]RAJ85300.1 AAA domain-containing protein [Streptomyces sp. PsTaAH-137]